MGERLLCKQEVVGSIPITSTTARTLRGGVRRKARQRCACTAKARRFGGAEIGRCDSGALAPREHSRGAREIDREEKVCAGALALARVIFDRVKRE